MNTENCTHIIQSSLRGISMLLLSALVALSIGMYTASASTHNATHLENQRAVYNLLIQIRDMQQHILDSRNYSLLPQVNGLLEQAVSLHTAVQTATPPPADSEQATEAPQDTPIDAMTYMTDCISGGETYDPPMLMKRIELDGVDIELENGRFVCQEDGWQPYLCIQDDDRHSWITGDCRVESYILPTACELPDGRQIPNTLVATIYTPIDSVVDGQLESPFDTSYTVQCVDGILYHTEDDEYMYPIYY